MTWEYRWHTLREEWIIIAANSPNQILTDEINNIQQELIADYDRNCNLCPGNIRNSGLLNDDYSQTYVFDSDNPNISFNAPTIPESDALLKRKSAFGISRIICYSPKHNANLSELNIEQIVRVLKVWQRQYTELYNHPAIASVLIYENKWESTEVKNPHPHCRVYAPDFVFKFLETEAKVFREYYNKNERHLFQDLIAEEKKDGRRILYENGNAIAFVPYFAHHLYNIYVTTKNSYPDISEIPDTELTDLASALQNTLIRLDNLWQMPFPYVMIIHQSPIIAQNSNSFQFYIEFYSTPHLSSNLFKNTIYDDFLAEINLRTISPEEIARQLLALPHVHYKKSNK